MKRVNIAIVLLVILAFVLWFRILDKDNKNIAVHLNYIDNKEQEILSETPYIPSRNKESGFIICQSREGKTPCHKIMGIKHGVEKWYKKGIIEYEDVYEYGSLIETNIYYPNGFIKQKNIYKNGNLIEKKNYSSHIANEVIRIILYYPTQTIKKYYNNNNLTKEEKYRGSSLVSRKIYDKEGLLRRLEEYGGFNNLFDNSTNNQSPDEQSTKQHRYREKRDELDETSEIWI